MNLDDDWLLENQPQERANLQMALYAFFLASGSSILSRSLKASTIALYLLEIARFLGRFRVVDPRFILATDGKLAPVIGKILEEQKR